MTEQRSGIWMLRRDLEHRRIEMRCGDTWVVKDPISGNYFYFDDREYSILRLADGRRDASEIADHVSAAQHQETIDADQVVSFLNQCGQSGLMVSAHGQGMMAQHVQEDSKAAVPRKWWYQPLAIRLPGVRPNRFLQSTIGFVAWLFTPAGFALAATGMIIAVAVVLMHFQEFIADIADVSHRLTDQSSTFGMGLIAVLITISATKLFHELGHAWACKAFGGECREMGIMLLVGIPCLYCDVSDAWMMSSRRHRIMVSAAGIWFEWILAALATFLWAASSEGWIHDASLVVMVACSINTLLFNGNPLLRYDGYFILSDFWGIPNLAQHATAALRKVIDRLVWGASQMDRSPENGDIVQSRIGLLAAYGIAMLLYRTTISIVIVMMLYRGSQVMGFGSFAKVLAAMAMIAIVWRFLLPWFHVPRHVRASRSRLVRGRCVQCMGVMTVVVLGFVPFPQYVVAPIVVQPAGAQPIYVTTAGAVIDGIGYGDDVAAGTVLATLRNDEVDAELIKSRSQRDKYGVQLGVLQRLRSSDASVASRIPVLKQRYERALLACETQEEFVDQLRLRSPDAGRFFAPPSKPRPIDGAHHAAFWNGLPLERCNQGAWLSPGTVIGIVGDADRREAIMSLDQRSVAFLQPGQRVTLMLADRAGSSVRGRVVEVAASPLSDRSERDDRLEQVHYPVRIEIDSHCRDLPVRLSCKARVSVTPASIWTRLHRFFQGTFG